MREHSGAIIGVDAVGVMQAGRCVPLFHLLDQAVAAGAVNPAKADAAMDKPAFLYNLLCLQQPLATKAVGFGW